MCFVPAASWNNLLRSFNRLLLLYLNIKILLKVVQFNIATVMIEMIEVELITGLLPAEARLFFVSDNIACIYM